MDLSTGGWNAKYALKYKFKALLAFASKGRLPMLSTWSMGQMESALRFWYISIWLTCTLKSQIEAFADIVNHFGSIIDESRIKSQIDKNIWYSILRPLSVIRIWDIMNYAIITMTS